MQNDAIWLVVVDDDGGKRQIAIFVWHRFRRYLMISHFTIETIYAC
jgi:hypothetical protein